MSTEEKHEQGSATRRAVIKTLAGGAAAFPILGQNPPPEHRHSSAPVTQQAAKEYRYRYFHPEQLTTLDALTETIIPTDDHSPGAKAAGVSQYIDEIVADAPRDTKQLWSDGLAMANDMAVNSFGKAYAECSSNEQFAIMSVLAGEHDPARREARFFAALKIATIDGYYTSSIGIHQDLQYRGNQALKSFPGCQHTH